MQVETHTIAEEHHFIHRRGIVKDPLMAVLNLILSCLSMRRAPSYAEPDHGHVAQPIIDDRR